MKVLLTGAAGYLGSSVILDLIRAPGVFVTTLDRLDRGPGPLDCLASENVERIDLDILKLPAWQVELLRNKIDVVIHLAGVVGESASSRYSPSETIRSNVEATRLLVKMFGDKIVFASTCSVYGRQSGLADEDTKPNPLGYYAESKLVAEGDVVAAGGYALRFGTIVGPSANMRWDTIMNSMIFCAAFGSTFHIVDENAHRPICSIKTASAALTKFARIVNDRNKTTAERIGRVYNILDTNLTKHEMVALVSDNANPLKTTNAPAQTVDARDYRVSADRVLTEHGFRGFLGGLELDITRAFSQACAS